METLKDLDLVRAMQLTPVLVRKDMKPADMPDGKKPKDMKPEDMPDGKKPKDMKPSGMSMNDMMAMMMGDMEMPTMRVDFSVFGTWYEIDSWFEGQFMERTMPGAFKKTIRENITNIRVLYDHGMDYQIGNKVLGPIERLEEVATGPQADVPLLRTSYNCDLMPGLEAGLYGSSFRFRVIKEEWNDEPGVSDWNPKGLPERSIKEVKLMEFGPVTFPANPDSTSGVRCLTDDYYGRVKHRQPEVYSDLVARTKTLRHPEAVRPDTSQETDSTLVDLAAVQAEVDARAAQHETVEPLEEHSQVTFIPTVSKGRVERKAAYMADYLALISKGAQRYDDRADS